MTPAGGAASEQPGFACPSCVQLGAGAWQQSPTGSSQLTRGPRPSRRPPAAAGEEPHTGIVASITTGSPALVTCIEDERLEFQVRLSIK